jgi:hypothetical protein
LRVKSQGWFTGPCLLSESYYRNRIFEFSWITPFSLVFPETILANFDNFEGIQIGSIFMMDWIMSDLFEIPLNYHGTAWADDEKYQQMYCQSWENLEVFWAEQAERLHWFKKWDQILDWNYHEANIRSVKMPNWKPPGRSNQ